MRKRCGAGGLTGGAEENAWGEGEGEGVCVGMDWQTREHVGKGCEKFDTCMRSRWVGT